MYVWHLCYHTENVIQFRRNSFDQAAAFNFCMNLLASQEAQKQKWIITILIVSKKEGKRHDKWQKMKNDALLIGGKRVQITSEN